MGRFATECTASVPVGTVRMRDRAKRPRCGTWRRRSRTGGRQGGFKALVKSRSPASAQRVAKPHLKLNLLDGGCTRPRNLIALHKKPCYYLCSAQQSANS